MLSRAKPRVWHRMHVVFVAKPYEITTTFSQIMHVFGWRLHNLFKHFIYLLPSNAFTAHGIYPTRCSLVLTPVLALTPPLTLNIRLLNNKDTTVNSVDNNVARLKGVSRPGASVPESVTAAGLDIIRRVDVKVSNLFDLGAVGELGDAGDVEDAEAGLVVGLVVKTVVDVLVVVDGAGRGLVVAGDDGRLEVLDVPDVGHGEAVLGGRVNGSAVGVDLALVELIVHDDVGLPHGIENPALMGVGSTDVRSARDDCTSVTEANLVGDVVDGQGVLVVAVANVTAVVLLVRSTVDNALSVVSVAILTVATRDVGLDGVVHVDKHGSTSTGVIATGTTASTAGDGVVLLVVGDDGVGTALDTLVDVDESSVGLDVESVGLLGGKLE